MIDNSDGLLGYWDFNNGNGQTLSDLSLNVNHGNIIGAEWSIDVPVRGCTDPFAENYNSDANFDDSLHDDKPVDTSAANYGI